MKRKNSLLHCIFSYGKEQIKYLCLFLFFCIIFFTVLFLYDLPLEASLYATLLCIFFGGCFFLWECLGYYKKYQLLLALEGSITLELEQLPDSENGLEEMYQNLLRELFLKKKELESVFFTARKDMTDYYTLWVHQIKTPITAMSLLLQSEESEKSALLRQELFRIEQYVDMVLQYLRMERMSSDLLLEEYDIEKIVRQAVKKYAPVFIHKRIRLTISPLNEMVLTDEKWLCFVIEQLLSNALKYTQEGEISIYMKQGVQKQLVIEDTGIGISGEDLPRVFEQGFTGYNGRMDKKASGLGLYLCRKILENLSHKIYIESKAGCGTKIILDLASKKVEIE